VGSISVQRLIDASDRLYAVERIALTGQHCLHYRLDVLKMCLQLFLLCLLH